MRFQKPIALALGGGGARGFAHVGVLRVLQNEGIEIGRITGTSMGSIVGAVYAQTRDARITETKLKQLLQTPVFQQSQNDVPHQSGPGSFMEQIFGQLQQQQKTGTDLQQSIKQRDAAVIEALRRLLSDASIEACKIPYAAVASDLLSGDEVILSRGSIVQAALASSALPGVFSPVAWDDKLLVDGAATSSVPVRAARSLQPKMKVIAVDVSAQLAPHPDLSGFFQIIMRSSAITGKCYQRQLVSEADVVIQPHVKLFNWSEFENVDDFIAEGEQAAVKQLPRIKKAARLLF